MWNSLLLAEPGSISTGGSQRVSARSPGWGAEGAKRAGCDAFVTKPCLPEDLVKEIRKVLDETAPAKKGRRSGKYAKSVN